MSTEQDLQRYSLIFYDGDCGLCNASVSYILKHDLQKTFHFLPLQSPTAHAFLRELGTEEILYDTMYFSEAGQVFNHSSAVIEITRRLPQRRHQLLSRLLSLIPQGLRDSGYRLLARNRHRLMKKPSCDLMTPEVRERFLT